MNKKGLWGFNDIANWWQAITGVLPKPVIFIIFLTIIILLAQLLTFFFNMNGIFCTSTNIPVQTQGNMFTSLVTNINLMSEMPDPDTINKEVIEVEPDQTSTIECSFCVDEGTIVFEDGTTQEINKLTCFYSNYAGGCYDCMGSVVRFSRNFLPDASKVCMGDAYPKQDSEKTFIQRAFCGAEYFGRCEPPKHYFYSQTDNYYRCADATCDGVTAGEVWDEKLVSRGATPIYKTIESSKLEGKAYNEGIGISCRDLRPKLSFYRLDIFDFKVWILILLLIILVWVYKTFIG
jgi:hypothetical protein